MTELRRCTQCWQEREPERFIGARGKPVNMCDECRSTYSNWDSLTPAEREARRPKRRGLRTDGPIRVTFKRLSGNRKTGRIPVSITSSETCPPSCSFYGQGCYAEFHVLRYHWARTSERGLEWAAFCRAVAALPLGQLWRHNEAGDLPGQGNTLAILKLVALVMANRGRRGFTFTHKPLPTSKDREAIAWANRNGFTINLSADSLEGADHLAALGIGPVAVVLPSTASDRGVRTPAGRHVVVCPAETAALTCADCQLCSKAQRKSVVGFRAHGQYAARVDQLVTLRRKEARAA